MRRGALSTTEYTVLGIVWRDGPCTTYHVMLMLASSSSSFYRKRASSTYGVVQNLTAQGLLAPVGDDVGKRGERPIGVTEEGISVLQKWLGPPVPPVEAAYSNDLIRLRVNFIAALDAADQVAFVEDALRALRVLEEEHEHSILERGELSRTLSLQGLLFETRARIAWLEHVLTVLPIARSAEPEPTGV
jgi:DNA-binding PadR family transcriptional regulator